MNESATSSAGPQAALESESRDTHGLRQRRTSCVSSMRASSWIAETRKNTRIVRGTPSARADAMSHADMAEVVGARVAGVRRVPAPVHAFWRDLWARTAVEGGALVIAYFVAWDVAERTLLASQAVSHLHALHLVRGIGAALMLGTWSFLRIRSARLHSDAQAHEYTVHLEDRVRERTRELEQARAFTELLFESLRERIDVVDDAGRVIKSNRGADRALDDGRVWELERIPVAATNEGASFVIEVRRDVTQQKNLEAQMRHQEKMAGLGMLTAGFAHDLGNPLASLSTELELLDGEDDMTEVRESLGVLRKQVARMSRTLREMVDFARRRRDEVADVSIAAAVSDSARLVHHDPRWKKVHFHAEVPNDLPPVHMVEDHLVLVLVNLMMNAADAMPAGGTLTVSACSTARGEVELRVRDTGTGMTPDVLARAKSPLFTTKGATRGTGLGLAVSDDIVRSLGGRLEITSSPGQGTDVVISLPAKVVTDG
jgi:signal transduction histidine kinase